MEEAFSENSVKFSDYRAFSLFKTVPGCWAFIDTSRFVVKNSCSSNYRCMTHNIYFVKTRTKSEKISKNKQMYYFMSMMVVAWITVIQLSVINNKKSIYVSRATICTLGAVDKIRIGPDRTGSDRTESRIGSRIGSQKEKKNKNIKSFMS